ncbi:hypothetical protein ACOIC7_29300, partial [Klebsiella pneumoniae]
MESTDAQILPLSSSVETYLNALAILIGEAPGTLDQRLSQPGQVPLPPAQVAVGDPTALQCGSRRRSSLGQISPTEIVVGGARMA